MGSSEEEKQVKAINKVRPSVVRIEVKTKTGGSTFGSGVVLTDKGYIVTNLHVLRDSSQIIVILFNEKKFHGKIIGESPRNDLAVIKINAEGLKVPEWGDSKKLEIGQVAIAIGNPFKFEGSVSRGIISALNRRIAASGIIYKELIQTDAAINPGNSGGALIDSSGKVIGINTLVYSGDGKHAAQGLGFAIPIHRALEVSRQLMARRPLYNPAPWIGVSGINVTREMAEMNMLPVNLGVLITNIQPVSPAERADLRKGDIVVQMDERIIRSVDEFKTALAQKTPGTDIVLKVWRGDKVIAVKVKVSQRSSPP